MLFDKIQSTLNWYRQNKPDDVRGFLADINRGKEEASITETTASLQGKKVFLVIGHEPGGGAKHERSWNTGIAEKLENKLEDAGAEVFVYEHRLRAYSARQREMAIAVRKYMSDADCVIELHYNDVDYPQAHGHEFHYYGDKKLAEAFRDSFQIFFPWSKPRRNNGILRNTSGRGSGFLKASPRSACLVEPFFLSNPEEKEKIFNNPSKLVEAYFIALKNYLV